MVQRDVSAFREWSVVGFLQALQVLLTLEIFLLRNKATEKGDNIPRCAHFDQPPKELNYSLEQPCGGFVLYSTI